MDDATIRLATPDDAQAIAQVRVAAWQTTHRGLIPDAYLAAMTIEDSTTLWGRILSAAPNKTNTFVVEINGQVAGFASGLMLAEPKHGFDAELTAVYLAHDAQRSGLGTRLVATVAAAQRAHGATGMIVWVIAGNKGARAFYERLDAELVLEQPFTWDGMDLVEAGYGWRDLPALIEAGGGTAVMH
jgi:GNAT superfamily N-acetyltransferase